MGVEPITPILQGSVATIGMQAQFVASHHDTHTSSNVRKHRDIGVKDPLAVV